MPKPHGPAMYSHDNFTISAIGCNVSRKCVFGVTLKKGKRTNARFWLELMTFRLVRAGLWAQLLKLGSCAGQGYFDINFRKPTTFDKLIRIIQASGTYGSRASGSFDDGIWLAWYFLYTSVTDETSTKPSATPCSTRSRINSKKRVIKEKIQTFTMVWNCWFCLKCTR